MLLLSFLVVTSLCLCQAAAHCRLRFVVDLVRDNSSISLLQISVSSEDASICTEIILPTLFDWPLAGLRPLVHILSSPQPSTFTHTLIAIPTLTNTSNSNGASWTLELPPYLQNQHLIVYIQQSFIGSGGLIHETRAQFEIPQDEVLCHSSWCLDSSVYETIVATLIAGETGNFSISYHAPNGVLVQAVPSCIGINEEEFSWSLINQNASCNSTFIPEKIYLVSINELYLTGGSSLLYSANKGEIFYHVTKKGRIKDFVTSEFRAFTVLIATGTTVEVWFGLIGGWEMIQLYPSPFYNEPIIYDTITFDSQNNLLLVLGSNSLELALPLSITNYFSLESTNCSNTTVQQDHPLHLFSTGVVPKVTLCPTRLCPFTSLTVAAPICGAFTRSKLHVVESESDFLMSRLNTFPEYNCSFKVDTLPKDIFLDKHDMYSFTLTFELQENETDSMLQLSVWTSDPKHLNITMNREYLEEENTTRYVIYKILLRVQEEITGRYVSGYSAVIAEVDIRVLGGTLQCLDPLSRLDRIPGHFYTKVHIGCPPGVKLMFYPEGSTARYNQHCKQKSDISCYYFNQAFYPVFKIYDDVTGEKSLYTGLYTLTAISGGLRAGTMTTLNRNNGIAAGIWAPLNSSINRNNPIYPNGSGIRWTCGSRSPCGEIIPLNWGSPRYFLKLEGSNKGTMDSQTFCDFIVEFVIEVHGITIGAVTLLMLLLLWLSTLSLLLLLTFIVWNYRVNLILWKMNLYITLHNLWNQATSYEWLIKEIKKNKSITQDKSSPKDSFMRNLNIQRQQTNTPASISQ